MEILIRLLLITHVIAGTISLVVAPIAMIVKKGGKQHRLWGKTFFWGMTIVFITGLSLSVITSNLFLFIIGVFTYYFIVSGYRALYRKMIHKSQVIPKLDWVIVIIAGLFNLGLLVLGILSLLSGSKSAFPYIMIVFGIIGIRFVYTDIRQFLSPPLVRHTWLYNHIGGMIGGYIAALSAFSATNLVFLPTVLRWLWPTLVGVPVIILWIRYYQKQHKKGKSTEELVTVKIQFQQEDIT